MLTSERTTKAGQIERAIHVSIWNNIIRVVITEHKQLKTKTTSASTTYILRKIESQIGGVGCEVEKLGDDGDVYHTLLNGRHGHECSCPHGVYSKSGVPCRHVLAALEAHQRGLI